MPSHGKPRQTPLFEQHVAAGGRMVDFAGWNMPVQYSGLIEEHIRVREAAGLFDVSHMGEAEVSGAGALAFLQHVTCNDVRKLSPGRAHYTALMTPSGGFVDDLLIYQRDEADYLLVLNAGNTAKDLLCLEQQSAAFEVKLRDASSSWAQLALQGPRAEEILSSLTSAELGRLRYYRFVEAEVEGVPSIVSRTGYTGEDGFEIYAPSAQAGRIWSRLLTVGAPMGILPVGLGARDTLRLEAKMALYGNDIDESTTPLEADLAWIVKLGKGDFVGRDVLAREAEQGSRRRLVGFEMSGKAIARHGYPVRVDGREVGRVTSGSFAPYLKKNIGMAYLPIEHARVGVAFEVGIRGRFEPALVVATPFYQRAR